MTEPLRKTALTIIPDPSQSLESARQPKEHQIILHSEISLADATLTLVEAAYQRSPVVRDEGGGLDTYESDLPHNKAKKLIEDSARPDKGVLAQVTRAYNRDLNIVIRDEGNGMVGLYDGITGEPLEGKHATKILQNASDRFDLLLSDQKDEQLRSHEPAHEQLIKLIELNKERFRNIKSTIKTSSFSPELLEQYPTLNETLDWLLEVPDWEPVESSNYPNTLRGHLPNGDFITMTPQIYPDMQSLLATRTIKNENLGITSATTVTHLWATLNDERSQLLIELNNEHEMQYVYKPSESTSEVTSREDK